jgi:hypothetical protein
VGVSTLRKPADMPWGERVSFVSDPEGDLITLAVSQPAELLAKRPSAAGSGQHLSSSHKRNPNGTPLAPGSVIATEGCAVRPVR